MRRGTTPTIVAKVNADISDMTIYLAFRISKVKGGSKSSCGSSYNKDLMVFTGDRLSVDYHDDKTYISCKLTQEETLKFPENSIIEVQVRAVKYDGDVAIATTIATVDAKRILQEGVLHG